METTNPNLLMQLITYVSDHSGQLLELTLQHILMVLCGIGLALIIGIPLGIISARNKRWSSIILPAANVIQVFPSIALLAILMIVFGLGFYTVVVGLFLYSLLPIIRNTYVGLTQVDRSITDAGKGMGMNPVQLLWKVQLPLSVPFLLAGLRVAAVIAIGVATMAPLIGGDGLGREIYSGINLRNPVRIYAGAIPAALLAIAADIGLGRLQNKWKDLSRQ
ncbi:MULTISPECIES: ABC transporter permease [unclassified Paenibacillus]|uniref:ABC transporter permease n=1 Tax=unclassified Paenibacillus TaxID=185978 RepID=UPI00362BDFAD